MSSKNSFEEILLGYQASAKKSLDSVEMDLNVTRKLGKIDINHRYAKDVLKGRIEDAKSYDIEANKHLAKCDGFQKGAISDSVKQQSILNSGMIAHRSIELSRAIEVRPSTRIEKAGEVAKKIAHFPVPSLFKGILGAGK